MYSPSQPPTLLLCKDGGSLVCRHLPPLSLKREGECLNEVKEGGEFIFSLSKPRRYDKDQADKIRQKHKHQQGIGSLRGIFKLFPDENTP